MFTPSQGMCVDMLSLSKFRPKESPTMELIIQDEIEAIASVIHFCTFRPKN